MKVAWVVYGALSQPTGGYVYDRLIVDRLRALGVEVSLISILPGSDPGELARVLAAARVDVIVGDALCACELAPAFEALPAGATKVLLVHHFGSWEVEARDRNALRALEARAVASSDHLMATSRWSAKELSQEYPDRLVDVVVPGADRLPRFSRAAADPSRIALLFVGSLVPRKRVPLLLDALAHLDDPRVTLRLVGDAARDASHAHEIAEIVARSTLLSAQVAFLGVLGDAPLATELARADALVLPSSLEGYGMVLTEALHAGLPLLCARAAAIPESVCDGEAALLFDSGDELECVLRRFARDPELRIRLQRAADSLAGTLPSWSAAGPRFHRSLTSAMRDAATPSLGHSR